MCFVLTNSDHQQRRRSIASLYMRIIYAPHHPTEKTLNVDDVSRWTSEFLTRV